MPAAAKTALAPKLTPEQRRERRQLRRQKQRENNSLRAAKMHAARLKMEATGLKAAAEPKASLYVGCSGWRYWDWRNSFYAGAPQPSWFEHYVKRFDTVEINASFYSWPTVVNVQAWQRGLGEKEIRLHCKSLRTHYPREEIQGHENPCEGLWNDRRHSRSQNGLLPFSAAAELSLYGGAAQEHRKSARSLEAQRRRIPARQLVERRGL